MKSLSFALPVNGPGKQSQRSGWNMSGQSSEREIESRWHRLYPELSALLKRHGNDDVIWAGALGHLINLGIQSWGAQAIVSKLETAIQKIKARHNVP